ncbi:MAG: hypothetical protein ACTH7G_01260 [Leuconostoc mesenteroides]
MADFFDEIRGNAQGYVIETRAIIENINQLLQELSKNDEVTRWFRSRISKSRTMMSLVETIEEQKAIDTKALEQLEEERKSKKTDEDDSFRISSERQELEQTVTGAQTFINIGNQRLEDNDIDGAWEMYEASVEDLNELIDTVNESQFKAFPIIQRFSAFEELETVLKRLSQRLTEEDEQARADFMKKKREASDKGSSLKRQDITSPEVHEKRAQIIQTMAERVLDARAQEVISSGELGHWQDFVTRFNNVASEYDTNVQLEPISDAGATSNIDELHANIHEHISSLKSIYEMKTFADLREAVNRLARDVSDSRGSRAFSNRLQELESSANAGVERFNGTYWQITGQRWERKNGEVHGYTSVTPTHAPVSKV